MGKTQKPKANVQKISDLQKKTKGVSLPASYLLKKLLGNS